MRVQIGGSAGNNSKEGIVVRVLDFKEEGAQVGVVGVNALTGQEITVWLTDVGVYAENKNRKSIKQLRDSFKMGKDRYKLEPKGLVHFKGCFEKKNCPNNYISTWANVLGYDEQSVKETVLYIKNCFVRFFTPTEEDTWKPFGYITSFQNSHIVGENIQELGSKITETRANIFNCTLLVRFLDHNNQVLGYFEIGSNKRFDKKEGREYTPEEYGANCVTLIEEQLANYNDVSSVNILVAKTWSISREGLFQEGSTKVEFWKWVATHFYKDVRDEKEAYRDYFCRDAFAKLSDPREKQVFVNNLLFPGKDDEVVTADPVLLGGLTYAGQEVLPSKTEDPVQPKSIAEQVKEEKVIEPEKKTVEESPKEPEKTSKVEPKDDGNLQKQQEEGIEDDPKGRAVATPLNENKKGKVQESTQQGLTKSDKESTSLSSDDYMDFEQALANGAF